MSRTPSVHRVLAAILLAGVTSLSPAAQDKPTKPQTKQTQFISQAVFKDLEKAQQAIDAKDYPGAIAALDVVKARGDKLNDYERATLYNLYAAVYYNQDDTPKAIASYIEVLKTPNLPEGLRDSTLFALAQMYFVTEDYPKAIQVLNRWFETVPEPSADAYVLLAQAHYQLSDFQKAEKALIDALKLAKQKQQAPKENWLALLRAVYYELGDYAKAAKVLEILVASYPSESYVLQLSGMYGLMGEQTKQLATLHAGYLGGMVTKKGDLLNLARLYLVEDVPYPAVQLLTKAFRDQVIEPEAETLQLYAQALALAQEREAQIPVLKRLAEMTGEARHYAFLGQAQAEAGNWQAAIDAFQSALKGKDLDDPDGIRMQLGTAQFNAGRLSDARRTFIAASESDKHGETAANWIKFVGAEIERKRAMVQMPDEPAPAPAPAAQQDGEGQSSQAPGADTGTA
ncbi:tetratricopeptide repeat protein [Sinimarinibacterium flocculans]|uniref:tetratricopeptide repeat protein n=1 Tax=Sinimarinibacterium flocculans TaxID=985250 RepID=UPI003519374C